MTLGYTILFTALAILLAFLGYLYTVPPLYWWAAILAVFALISAVLWLLEDWIFDLFENG